LRFKVRGKSSSSHASSTSKDSKGAVVFLTLFFGLFLLVGLSVLYFLTIRPIFRVMDARDWSAVQCTILSSRVGKHTGSKGGSTYSIDIRYEYVVDGKRYESDRYKFLGGSSSGYDGKKQIVDSLPPGSEVICYVNPQDPSDAVIERGYTADMWFGLIPLVFVVIGGGGIFFTVRTRYRAKRGISELRQDAVGERRAASDAEVEAATYLPDIPQLNARGKLELNPSLKPVGTFIAVLLFTLIWNGGLSLFAYKWWEEYERGHPSWFTLIFLTPFFLIGLFVVVLTVYQFLAMFNPAPFMLADQPSTPLGEVLHLQWSFTGRVGRIQKLRIKLIGEESATYRSGKNNSTATEEFYEQLLIETEDRYELQSGELDVTIPAESMHSLKSGGNQISWRLQLHADVPRWPDVKAEYPIVVTPKHWEASQ